jgi:hypothetical protein
MDLPCTMFIQGFIVMHHSALGRLYVMTGHVVIAAVPISCEWRAVCASLKYIRFLLIIFNEGAGNGLFQLADMSHT